MKIYFNFYKIAQAVYFLQFYEWNNFFLCNESKKKKKDKSLFGVNLCHGVNNELFTINILKKLSKNKLAKQN